MAIRATDRFLLVGELCGNMQNLATDSEEHMMLIQYTGGISDGFIAHYRVEGQPDELPVSSCSGITLLDSSVAAQGTITDGTQGTPFPVNCTWLLTAPQGSFVALNVTFLQTGVSFDGCQNKYLAVYDGADELSYPFFSTCGSMLPQAFLTTGNTAFIKFVNLVAKPASFAINWGFVSSPGIRSSRCFNLPGTAMLIDSPVQITQSFSIENFRRGLMCSWLVVAPPSRTIVLKWGNISWQKTQLLSCSSHIDISSSASDTQTAPLRMLCNNVSVPIPFESSRSTLFITMFAYQDLRFSVNVTFKETLLEAAGTSSTVELSTEMIALISILAVFLACIILVVVICIIRERARRKLMHLDLDGGQQLEMQQHRVY